MTIYRLCPVCRSEYTLVATRCIDCDVDLVDANALAPEEEQPVAVEAIVEAQPTAEAEVDEVEVAEAEQPETVEITFGLKVPYHAWQPDPIAELPYYVGEDTLAILFREPHPGGNFLFGDLSPAVGQFDDAEGEPPKGWPYEYHERCWGRHTCSMGVIKALKALAEVPPDKRRPEVAATIENGAEYFLRHHVYKRSHNLNRACKPEWRRFGFPRMWHTDALEILRILTRLGYHDSRMQEAIDLVISKQDERGIWKLDDTFNGSFQVNIEVKGQPSKWVTLNALRVLKLLDNHGA